MRERPAARCLEFREKGRERKIRDRYCVCAPCGSMHIYALVSCSLAAFTGLYCASARYMPIMSSVYTRTILLFSPLSLQSDFFLAFLRTFIIEELHEVLTGGFFLEV